MSSVDDIRWKVKRAQDHLEDFKANFFGRRGPIFPLHAVDLHFEPHGKSVTITSKPLDPEQKVWLGILLGDVIHQLRASLDHVVYALATRPGRPPPSKKELHDLSFLIRADGRGFAADARVSQGVFERLIGTQELADMEAAQPYKRSSIAPLTDPLWRLHKLDNVDKHRTFVIIEHRVRGSVTAYSDDGALSHTMPFVKTTDPTKPNAELFDLGWPHPKSPATVNMDGATRHVEFAETDGLCDGIEVFGLARSMIATVDDIVVKFDPFFPN